MIASARPLKVIAADLAIVKNSGEKMSKGLTLLDTAIQNGIFQTFTKLLEGSRLEMELRRPKPYTLFAPADIAFAYLPAETLDSLIRAENAGMLEDLLGFHDVPGRFLLDRLKELSTIKTACGADLTISNVEEVRLGGARLLHVDIETQYGVIHAIDRLLIPVQRSYSATV